MIPLNSSPLRCTAHVLSRICFVLVLSAESTGLTIVACFPLRQPKLLTWNVHCEDHKESPCTDCFCSWVATSGTPKLLKNWSPYFPCYVLLQGPDNLLVDLPNTVHCRSRHGVVTSGLTSQRRYTSLKKHLIFLEWIYRFTGYGTVRIWKPHCLTFYLIWPGIDSNGTSRTVAR